MRRIFIIILSFLVLFAAAASDAQRTSRKSRSKSRTTKVSKKRSSRRSAYSAPIIPVNIDSINAVRRAEAIRDSLATLNQRIADDDVNAMDQLAMWYYTGHNVDQNYGQAIALWEKACLGNSPSAMANLGRCYQTGIGVPRDSVHAAQLYLKSIKGGNGALFKQMLDSSAVNLFDAMLIAECYEKGEGVRRDLAHAAQLYSQAADMGSADGLCKAAICYFSVNDTVNALPFLDKGARLGNIECQYLAGKLVIDDASSTPAQRLQAEQYVHNAAEAGMAEAQNLTALLSKDQQIALTYWRRAANQGHPEAMWHYADALKSGTGTPVNYDQALYWMAKAMNDGYQVDVDDLTSDATSPFTNYLKGMQAYLVNHDFTAANQYFKKANKGDTQSSGKVMQNVILADKSNPKGKPAKAVQKLEKMAETTPAAAFWLATIYSNVPGDYHLRAKALMKRAADSGYVNDISCLTEFLKTLSPS